MVQYKRCPNFVQSVFSVRAYNISLSAVTTPRIQVGDRVKVSLPLGHTVNATIRAVIEHTDGIKLQVD